MCYSAEADLVAGLVVGAVGIDALRHVDDRRHLPLAAIPIVLATHQLVEAVAWWSLEGRLSPASGYLAVTAYLVIALGLVPILVPYAVMRAEPDPGRRARMQPLIIVGLAVSVVLLYGIATNPYEAAIAGRYIDYDIVAPGGGLTGALYVLATCAPLLMSSHQRLVIFGMINVLAVVLLLNLLSSGLISLWCVWAAVSSIVIAHHLREESVGPLSPMRRSLAS